MKDIYSKAKQIRIFISDVDGVLTDGKLYIGRAGLEQKSFHIKDGYGLRLLQQNGIQVVLLSGRHSEATATRARELGIEEVNQGIKDKLSFYERLLREKGLRHEQAAYMGDDLMDIPVLLQVGLAATVADGAKEVKEVVDYIAVRKGGEGAVREMSELILMAQGRWNGILRDLGINSIG